MKNQTENSNEAGPSSPDSSDSHLPNSQAMEMTSYWLAYFSGLISGGAQNMFFTPTTPTSLDDGDASCNSYSDQMRVAIQKGLSTLFGLPCTIAVVDEKTIVWFESENTLEEVRIARQFAETLLQRHDITIKTFSDPVYIMGELVIPTKLVLNYPLEELYEKLGLGQQLVAYPKPEEQQLVPYSPPRP